MEQLRRTMALDVGEARVGIALSDPLGLFAQPLCTIERKSGQLFENLIIIVKEHNVKTIVIGYPYELDGSVGLQAKKVELFSNELKNIISILETCPTIVYWDERFTSAQAEHLIMGSRLKNQDRRKALDKIAAAIILESYLQAKGNGS